MGGEGSNAHPTRGALATALAAHFVHYVRKSDEIKALFDKFVELHNNPVQTLRRLPLASLAPQALALAFADLEQLEEVNLDEDEVLRSPRTSGCPCPHRTEFGVGASQCGAGGCTPQEKASAESRGNNPHGPPWEPFFFSASSRA